MLILYTQCEAKYSIKVTWQLIALMFGSVRKVLQPVEVAGATT
jgi:hypothetical protein